jgi:hypothetical protein
MPSPIYASSTRERAACCLCDNLNALLLDCVNASPAVTVQVMVSVNLTRNEMVGDLREHPLHCLSPVTVSPSSLSFLYLSPLSGSLLYLSSVSESSLSLLYLSSISPLSLLYLSTISPLSLLCLPPLHYLSTISSLSLHYLASISHLSSVYPLFTISPLSRLYLASISPLSRLYSPPSHLSLLRVRILCLSSASLSEPPEQQRELESRSVARSRPRAVASPLVLDPLGRHWAYYVSPFERPPFNNLETTGKGQATAMVTE